MNLQAKQIADRIKELREIMEMGKAEIAGHVGISEEQYDAYESGREDIPIGILYAIATFMSVDPTVLLTGDSPRMGEYTIVRKGQGMHVERHEGYAFASLAYNFKGREMEPMVVRVTKGARPELMMHGGQEFNYVLKGSIKLTVGSREFDLVEGDSAYFNPSIPHSQTAITDEAVFLTVINE